MTVDLSDFQAVSTPKSTCWFGRLAPEQQAKVTAANEAGYSHPTISNVISGWGVKVGRSAISAHFRGECRCD